MIHSIKRPFYVERHKMITNHGSYVDYDRRVTDLVDKLQNHLFKDAAGTYYEACDIRRIDMSKFIEDEDSATTTVLLRRVMYCWRYKKFEQSSVD